MNRRKFPRFMLRGPWTAQLHSCTEVTVDEVRAGQFYVISTQPAKPAELLTLELSSGRTEVEVRVVSSTPVFVDDIVFHCVRLEGRDQSAENMDAVALAEREIRRICARPLLGSLAGIVPVVLLEMSRRGCLLESHAPLAEGSIGRLRVENAGGPFVDDIRITWSLRIEGAGSRYHAGAEFLPISRPAEWPRHASLRTALPTPQPPSLSRQP